MSTPRIIVVGGGISGLSLAVTLQEEARRLAARLDLVVLERDQGVGGHARTLAANGFLAEAGPNGFLNREPETLALIEMLQLSSQVIAANPALARRYIVRGGRLCVVPTSPLTLWKTPALSWRGKARLLMEPWAPGSPGIDESVYDFAARRIGVEAASVLVDTAVSGISAGDSRLLSIAAQFPAMVEMEREHGSLFRAMLARRRSGLLPPRLLTFDQGIGALPRAMLSRLGGAVVTGAGVSALERHGGTWRVGLEDGCWIEGDHVVFAVPARVTARLVRALDPVLAEALADVSYSGVAVVALGYRAADIPRPLDGYGYLVTRDEEMATLGVVWESSLFAGRAPEGHVLLRVMLGGSRMPSMAGRSEAECLAAARADLAQVLGIQAEPVHVAVFRWPEAIAQYTIGHRARMERLRGLAARYPRLHVCGTSYDGVSLNHAVKSGRGVARDLAAAMWGGDAAAAGRGREAITV